MRGIDDVLVYPCAVLSLLQQYKLEKMYSFAILELVDSIFVVGNKVNMMMKEQGQKQNEKKRTFLVRYFCTQQNSEVQSAYRLLCGE